MLLKEIKFCIIYRRALDVDVVLEFQTVAQINHYVGVVVGVPCSHKWAATIMCIVGGPWMLCGALCPQREGGRTITTELSENIDLIDNPGINRFDHKWYLGGDWYFYCIGEEYWRKNGRLRFKFPL